MTDVRSVHGCWTCRLRHKKCDESRPSCISCSTRGLACLGYAAKPEWMDGGEVERRKRNEIKRIVKQNRRVNQERVTMLPTPQSSVSNLSTPLLEYSQSIYLPSESTSSPDEFDHEILDKEYNIDYHLYDCFSSFPPHSSTENDPSTTSFPPHSSTENTLSVSLFPSASPLAEHISSTTSESRSQTDSDSSLFDSSYAKLEDREAILLMHYLDSVFYVQFALYNPLSCSYGRGWFLSLLRGSKPLYYGTLALSAYHLQSLHSGDQSNKCESRHSTDLKRYENLSIQGLRHNLQNDIDSLRGGIESLCCMIQLIFLEVYCPSLQRVVNKYLHN
jgi:hypothetical protein